MQKFFSNIATRTAVWMGHPYAFIGAVGACILWAVSGPLFNYSDTWQLVINTATTVLTFLAVFLIQNSQNRDGAAIQAKLDELLRAGDKARSQFIGIEHLTESQIAMIRRALQRQAKAEAPARVKSKAGKSTSDKGKSAQAKTRSVEDTADRLLDRY